MQKASNEDKTRLIEYLGSDIDNCVYLYIDIKTCDICSENVTVWFDEKDGEIASVLMKYYDSFQVYTRDPAADITWMKALIDEYGVSMISGPKALIERLDEMCGEYEASYGAVFECPRERDAQGNKFVEMATADDTRELAELLCTDDEFAKNYKVDILAKQLADRIREKKGRSYIVRADGKIVASTSTFAETDDVAVVSGAIVDRAYRDTDYFTMIDDQMRVDMYRAGKRCFAFASKKRMITFMSLNNNKCADYGKLHRK